MPSKPPSVAMPACHTHGVLIPGRATRLVIRIHKNAVSVKYDVEGCSHRSLFSVLTCMELLPGRPNHKESPRQCCTAGAPTSAPCHLSVARLQHPGWNWQALPTLDRPPPLTHCLLSVSSSACSRELSHTFFIKTVSGRGTTCYHYQIQGKTHTP